MHIASIRIRNFRGLRDVEIPLAQTTVLIGENNAGKSSVLDCISLTLGRRWGQRGTGFSEYDLTIHGDATPNDPSEPTNSSRSNPPDVGVGPAVNGDAEADDEATKASIELFFREQNDGEWPEEITTGLFGIIQTDPVTCLNSITLRVTYKLNPVEKDL